MEEEIDMLLDEAKDSNKGTIEHLMANLEKIRAGKATPSMLDSVKVEAYGASSILREILTVKSDDVLGRAKTYEAIVKGEPMPEPGLPESFNVLMHELKGLALDVRLEE